jgi:hypothetical protein
VRAHWSQHATSILPALMPVTALCAASCLPLSANHRQHPATASIESVRFTKTVFRLRLGWSTRLNLT